MTKVLTLRLPPELLNKAERRATMLGLDRAKYVRGMIERDVARKSNGRPRKHVFASEDLAGYYEGDGLSATNEQVRERLRQRASGKR